MTVKGKIGTVLFCLAFALPFGGVGVFATWMIAGSFYDGYRARDWVLVKADVTSYNGRAVAYRYSWDGREFIGTRKGVMPFGGGSSNVDDWDERVDDFLSTAVKERKPIMVHVNPDNPAESVLDRDIRWALVL